MSSCHRYCAPLPFKLCIKIALRSIYIEGRKSCVSDIISLAFFYLKENERTSDFSCLMLVFAPQERTQRNGSAKQWRLVHRGAAGFVYTVADWLPSFPRGESVHLAKLSRDSTENGLESERYIYVYIKEHVLRFPYEYYNTQFYTLLAKKVKN